MAQSACAERPPCQVVGLADEQREHDVFGSDERVTHRDGLALGRFKKGVRREGRRGRTRRRVRVAEQGRGHTLRVPQEGLDHMTGIGRRRPLAQGQALGPAANEVVRGGGAAALTDLWNGRALTCEVLRQPVGELVAAATKVVGDRKKEVLLAAPVVAQSDGLLGGSPFHRRNRHADKVRVSGAPGTGYGSPPVCRSRA